MNFSKYVADDLILVVPGENSPGNFKKEGAT